MQALVNLQPYQSDYNESVRMQALINLQLNQSDYSKSVKVQALINLQWYQLDYSAPTHAVTTPSVSSSIPHPVYYKPTTVFTV